MWTLSLGKNVHQLCQDIKNFSDEIDERLLRIQAAWVRISAQMRLSPQIIDVMDEAHREIHYEAMLKAEEKLQEIYRPLQTIRGSMKTIHHDHVNGVKAVARGRGAIRYAIEKKRLDCAIEDLESWQRIHDISWLLIMKMATQVLGAQTSRETPSPWLSSDRASIGSQNTNNKLRLKKNVFDTLRKTKIPLLEGSLGMRGSEQVIIDNLTFGGTLLGHESQVKGDVKGLVQLLQEKLKSCVGILEPKVYVEDKDPSLQTLNFTILFKMPPGMGHPQSLRYALSTERCPSLCNRIEISQDLAASISHIHILGIVHKDIRPETVLLLSRDETPLLATYLIGFRNFRKDDGITTLLGDDEWQKNIYRSPRRYGKSPGEAYVMQHDIFSLGVCLLEIGLWKSFVEYSEANLSKMPSQTLNLNSLHPEIHHLVGIKSRFLALAEEHLPQSMGTKYTEVVKTCLTCLDENNDDFGDDFEFSDKEDVLVGVRYIEKVSRLEFDEPLGSSLTSRRFYYNYGQSLYRVCIQQSTFESRTNASFVTIG